MKFLICPMIINLEIIQIAKKVKKTFENAKLNIIKTSTD